MLLTAKEIGNIHIGVQDEHHKPQVKDCWEPDAPLFRAVAKAQLRKVVKCLGEHEICDPVTHKVEGYWLSVEDYRKLRLSANKRQRIRRRK